MPLQIEQHNEPHDHTVTIAASGSLSSAVRLKPGYDIAAIVMPSAWTAADITFQASADNGTTYNNVYDEDGNELTLTVAASRYVVIAPNQFRGAELIKVRSGTGASAVNQAAARSLTLVTLPS